MPTYKGNRGNLLQHWVLAELVTSLENQGGAGAELCFIDAHSMSPYATRDLTPGSTAGDFEIVRNRLPGQGSTYERAWRELVAEERVEYPTSAMFVRHLWPGPLQMILCEADTVTADDIIEWQRTLPIESQIELHRGDWRTRLRDDLPRTAACLVSFDPYMIIGENPAAPMQGHMYLQDLVRAAAGILDIQSGPLLVQLSTYSAQNNSQDEIVAIVEWIMAAVGLELVDAVRASGHMMSMVLTRDVAQRPVQLHERFNAWLGLAATPPRISMTDWIYCGTDPPAGAASTQSLLRTHQAIWCSPPGLRAWPGTPAAGDRLWLVWRGTAPDSFVVLGGGVLLRAPRELYQTDLLWTDPDLPGLR